MQKSKHLVVAAIPAFNEERTIARIVLLAQKHVDKVIVCDDGSTDMTSEIAEGLGAEVLRHERNLGYGATIQSLFKRIRELKADVMVTLDADGQHDPRDIPLLIRPVLEEGVDVVVGSRFLEGVSEREVPRYRRAGIKAITRLMDATSKYGASDAQSGFRGYGRKAIEGLRLSESGMGVSVEILLGARDLGLRVVEVPVGCRYRGLVRTSTYGPLRHGVDVVMSVVKLMVEERPLLFLGLPGAVSLLVGVLFGVWMLQLYVMERRIVTNIALASMAFVLIGFFALSTAITLYAIARLMQKATRQ